MEKHYLKNMGEITYVYGVDLEEHTKVIEKQQKRIAELEQDRDTWERACELASETLKQVMGKPLWIGGNIPTPEVKDSDYFYQQAKKERNDE